MSKCRKTVRTPTFARAATCSAVGRIGDAARDLHVFLMQTPESSTFGQAARFWLDQLGPIGVMATPREPRALWRALRIVGDAERLLSERRDDAAAARCHEALDLLGKGVEGDAFITEAERHVRQRAYIALAQGHAREATAAPGDNQRRAASRKALEQLQLAVLHDFCDARQLAQDADLRALADSPTFQGILRRIRSRE